MKVEIELSSIVLSHIEEIIKAEKALEILQTTNVSTYLLEEAIQEVYDNLKDEVVFCVTGDDIVQWVKKFQIEFPDGLK